MWNQDWWGFAAYWRPEWTIPAAGVAAAVVAFSAGRTVVRVLRRGKDNAPVNLLADPAIQGSLKDQRAAMRRAGNPVGVQMRDPEGQGNELTAWVVDRSVGGLSLHMD